MRFGFALRCYAGGGIELSLYGPKDPGKSGRPALTSWARDPLSGTVVVLLGRLFYRDEIRARLPALASMQGDSDTALALALYQHAGREGLQQLDGEFALVVWDGVQRCL